MGNSHGYGWKKLTGVPRRGVSAPRGGCGGWGIGSFHDCRHSGREHIFDTGAKIDLRDTVRVQRMGVVRLSRDAAVHASGEQAVVPWEPVEEHMSGEKQARDD